MPRNYQSATGAIEMLISAAQRHGENSEPDREVGDLQTMLRWAWVRLAPGDREAMWGKFAELVEENPQG